ncbi:uncharacterized protein GLRG_04693 [Colletotrichum graminicola M1.001]|uniref:Uncharacterized protein n=1 Tax=Colletotrichum graminicola (strain M1.001 / M2 / FGSC 10212) TaxID=645133 RepID=E3QFB1_COLGM|nr:uncharacterized protein GLRG_04693 [Colletotrichum graminicola M1.001]EFQ29549.1 hypothetical protein GLRG_04693 [Colletotrichum graminicola M1.001]
MSEPRAVADNRNDGADEMGRIGDDSESTISSEFSDRNTSVAFSLAFSPVTPSFENEPRELGLSARGRSSESTDYDVITVHGLRDNHSTMWMSKSGVSWLQERLFDGLSVRQLDFIYATHDSARVFQPDGIEVESRDLLRQYAEKRLDLPDALVEASQAVLPSDFEDVETWERMREARGQIAKLSTTIIFLGCPHKAESIDVLEDELHTLMSLPGPSIESGLIRKIKNIAFQVEDTNTRFLESKLLSRLVHSSVFNLGTLQDLKAAEEKKPTDDAALEIDKSKPDENRMQDENISVTSEDKSSFVAADIPQPDKDDLAAPDVDTNTKDVNENDNVEDHSLEEAVNHADDAFEPMVFASLAPNLGMSGTKIDQHKDAESSSVLVTTKEDSHLQGEIPQPALTELPVLRGSPFSRYTSCMYSMFEVHSRWRQNIIDHAALVRGDEDVIGRKSWIAIFRERFEPEHYGMLIF